VRMGSTLTVGMTTALAIAAFTPTPAVSAEVAGVAVTPQCTKALGHLPNGPSGGVWVPASSENNRLCWMQRYNYSDGVWALQRALRYCYGQNIAVDKDFGPATQSALFRVQGWIGAGQDGKYGPETARRMKFSSISSDAPEHCSIQTF
jgi:hypothetical protein